MNDLKFHHLGAAVSDIDKSMTRLAAMDYCIGELTYDPIQDARLVMCTHPSMPDIELIFNPERFKSVLKGQDFVIYHMCFETSNLSQALSNFGRKIQISKPEPAALFNGRAVSFFKIDGLGIVEFLEQ